MSSHDNDGREYLKLSEAKAGMKVELDNEFDCAKGIVELRFGVSGVWFPCSHGEHLLEGQCDDESDYCIGVYSCNDTN